MPLKPVYATYEWTAVLQPSPYKYCPHCAAPLDAREIDHLPRAFCPQCGFVHFRNPAPGVSVFVVDGAQVLLTLRRGPMGGGKWALPSGNIEFHEDYLTAGRREVREETGLEVQITGIINVESAFLGPDWHFFSVYLLAHPVGGALGADDDAAAVDWFPIAGPLPEMAFTLDVAIIEQYTTGKLLLLAVGE